MPYVIETWDKPDSSAIRAAARVEHLAYLDRHASRLIACGAKIDDDGKDLGGGIYVLDTESRAEAEKFIAEDPFTTAGLFDRIQIVRQRRAYLNGKRLV